MIAVEPSIREGNRTLDAKQLFLARCNQIESIVDSPHEIDVLDLSGKLRQLLADRHSLLSAANTIKIPLEFWVNDMEWEKFEAFGFQFGIMPDGLDPYISGSREPTAIKLNLQQFLAHPVIFYFGQKLTVLDVIKYAANSAGGVHHDPTPRSEYRSLAELHRDLSINGLPGSTQILRSIAKVTLRSLDPLIRQLTS